jgi:hypothetical protein
MKLVIVAILASHSPLLQDQLKRQQEKEREHLSQRLLRAILAQRSRSA